MDHNSVNSFNRSANNHCRTAALENFRIIESGKVQNGIETKTFVFKNTKKGREDNGQRHELRVAISNYNSPTYQALSPVPNTDPTLPIGRHVFVARTSHLYESNTVPICVDSNPVTGVADYLEILVYGYVRNNRGEPVNYDLKRFRVEVNSRLDIKIHEDGVLRLKVKLSNDGTRAYWKTHFRGYDWNDGVEFDEPSA